MAVRRIILLSGQTEGPFLADILKSHGDGLVVDAVNSKDTLVAASSGSLVDTRLISFCSALIVPGELLARLPGPAYNFHPGPPEYPGRYPSVFALYDGAKHFGITVHEMATKVDAGPIVAADWFVVNDGCDLAKLEELTFGVLVEKFRAMAAHLATLDRALTRMPYRWGSRKTTKADCDSLCQLTPDLDQAEVAPRKRACGQHLK